jgi:hypothetical protein
MVAILTSHPAQAQKFVDIIGNPPYGVDPVNAVIGGGEPAQQLARSIQGIRSGDGSIDPTLLTGAVNSYNSYIKSLIASSQATQKPASELDGFVKTLPPGQKAAQVVLGKLLEAAR